jgi:hypothetical protein
MSMDEHVVTASIGSAHRDGDDESSNSMLESATDRENNAITSFGCGVDINWDGNTKPSSDTSRLAR